MTLISRPQWWLKPNLPEKRDTEEGEGGDIHQNTHSLFMCWPHFLKTGMRGYCLNVDKMCVCVFVHLYVFLQLLKLDWFQYFGATCQIFMDLFSSFLHLFFVFILRSHFILKSFHLYCPYEVNLWDIYELDLSKFIRVKKEERTLKLQRENKVEHPPAFKLKICLPSHLKPHMEQ